MIKFRAIERQWVRKVYAPGLVIVMLITGYLTFGIQMMGWLSILGGLALAANDKT